MFLPLWCCSRIASGVPLVIRVIKVCIKGQHRLLRRSFDSDWKSAPKTPMKLHLCFVPFGIWSVECGLVCVVCCGVRSMTLALVLVVQLYVG